jgi:hypothetical protein
MMGIRLQADMELHAYYCNEIRSSQMFVNRYWPLLPEPALKVGRQTTCKLFRRRLASNRIR